MRVQADLHNSIASTASEPIVTERERLAIMQAATALQCLINGCPFFGSLQVVLAPSEAPPSRGSRALGSDVALFPSTQEILLQQSGT